MQNVVHLTGGNGLGCNIFKLVILSEVLVVVLDAVGSEGHLIGRLFYLVLVNDFVHGLVSLLRARLPDVSYVQV